MKIWQVHHIRECDDGTDDAKQVGIFDSLSGAQQAVELLRMEPGFRQFPDDFLIDEIELNHLAWREGFATLASWPDERPGVDALGRSEFWYAAHDGRVETALAMAQARPELLVLSDDAGLSPLHAAVLGGRVEAVRFLIDSGADVNALDNDGDGPLWEAARRACFDRDEESRLEIARLLAEAGADRYHQDRYGQSPMLVASRDAGLLKALGW